MIHALSARKARCRESPCRGSTFCRIEGHSGYQKQKKHCRDCLCSLYSCLGGIYTSCWIKGHSGYGKANTECRDCKGGDLCRTAGHLGYQKAKTECRDCKGVALCRTDGHSGYQKTKTECLDCKVVDLCRTAGHSGYHNHQMYCLNCQRSTGAKRRTEKLERRKKKGSWGSFWSKGKGNSADTIDMAECVCAIL